MKKWMIDSILTTNDWFMFLILCNFINIQCYYQYPANKYNRIIESRTITKVKEDHSNWQGSIQCVIN